MRIPHVKRPLSSGVRICGFLLAGCFLAGELVADDLERPPWDRSQRDTTIQEWGFADPARSLPEPGWKNPFGEPHLDVESLVPPHMEWLEGFAGRTGVWRLDGATATLKFSIPNTAQRDREKIIQIQVTSDDVSGERPHVEVRLGNDDRPIELRPMYEDSLDGPWMHRTYMLTASPCPDKEEITISAGPDKVNYVDQVVIDTICRPCRQTGCPDIDPPDVPDIPDEPEEPEGPQGPPIEVVAVVLLALVIVVIGALAVRRRRR